VTIPPPNKGSVQLWAGKGEDYWHQHFTSKEQRFWEVVRREVAKVERIAGWFEGTVLVCKVAANPRKVQVIDSDPGVVAVIKEVTGESVTVHPLVSFFSMLKWERNQKEPFEAVGYVILDDKKSVEALMEKPLVLDQEEAVGYIFRQPILNLMGGYRTFGLKDVESRATDDQIKFAVAREYGTAIITQETKVTRPTIASEGISSHVDVMVKVEGEKHVDMPEQGTELMINRSKYQVCYPSFCGSM
jgi:hypothetical protein